MTKTNRRLIDLEPHWIEHEGRICGLSFACPEHGDGDRYCRIGIPFTPAMDGTVSNSWQSNRARWQRTGGVYFDDQRVDGFADITLTPSIRSGCGYHGFITNGEVSFCEDSH